MANAVAFMAAPSLETSLSGTRVLSISSSRAAVSAGKTGVVAVRAHQGEDVPSQSRRSLLSLVTASLASTVLVRESRGASSIKLEGPPLPSGGLPGTENSDQARDTDLPLKERFYLQPKSPAEATERIKESVKAIMDVKSLIDKKAWPYVQNGLRSSASYLRYDLNTVLSAKSKEEKKSLKALTTKLLDSINNLDYAARSKSVPEAEKYYSETVGLLKDVLSQM